MTLLTTAQKWNDAGIATIPIGYRAKRPDFAALRRVGSVSKNGKGIWQTYQKRLPTMQELKTWFSNNLRNIAIVTGWQNLVILDIDNLALYGVWKLWATHTRPELLNTYRVQTSRGLHLYYYMQKPPETGLKWPGIDVKAAGGYCLIDPSIHPSGTPYKALENKIMTVQNVNSILPDELIQKLPVRQEIKKPKPVAKNNPFAIRDIKPSRFVKENVWLIDFFDVQPHGRFVAVKCPLHDDTHASGWIDTERNRYGCQTCVNGSMDVIDFYSQLKNISMTEAIRELAK